MRLAPCTEPGCRETIAHQAVRVVMFSGGAASFCAAERTVEAYGAERTHLLFCDVGEEDESTYQAVRDGAKAIGCELLWTQAGTVWGLFFETGMMGKPGSGHCSRILKREHAKQYVSERYEAAETKVVIGLTWEELHRLEGPRKFWSPFEVEYPMAEEPWLTKSEQVRRMEAAGVTVPELYRLGGFEHANCAGACVKAGHGQWLRLLEVRPEVYARWEKNEREFREVKQKDVSILRDRTGGTLRPLTLEELRKRHERGGQQVGLFTDGGAGCGCFSDDD